MQIMINDALSYFKLEVAPDTPTLDRACSLQHSTLSSPEVAVTTSIQSNLSGSAGETEPTIISENARKLERETGSLVHCGPWGRREQDTTWRLNNNSRGSFSLGRISKSLEQENSHPEKWNHLWQDTMVEKDIFKKESFSVARDQVSGKRAEREVRLCSWV